MSIGLSGGNISLPQLPGLIPVGSPNLVPNGDFSQYHNTGTVYSDVLTESVNYGWTLNASGSFTFGSTGAVSTVNGATINNGNPNWKPLTASSGGNSLPLTVQATFTEPSTLPLSNAGSVALYENATNYYQAYSNGSTFYLVKNVAGTVTSLASVAQALTASSTYTVTLGIDISGHLTAKLYSGSGTGGTLLQTLTATDTSLSGGFVIQVGGDTGVIITDVVVTAAVPDDWIFEDSGGNAFITALVVGAGPAGQNVWEMALLSAAGNVGLLSPTFNAVLNEPFAWSGIIKSSVDLTLSAAQGIFLGQNPSAPTNEFAYASTLALTTSWQEFNANGVAPVTGTTYQMFLPGNTTPLQSSQATLSLASISLTKSTTAQAFSPPFPVLDRPIDASGLSSGAPAIELGSGYGLFQGGNANLNSAIATDIIIEGLTGATAASRYVGATTSGYPITGTFAVGDVIVDQSGAIWICTTSGTPGSGIKVGASPVKTFVSDLEITATTLTTITSYTPSAQGNFLVDTYFRVITAPTTVLITITWDDGTGAQTYTVANGTYAVGSVATIPLYINATTAAPITVQVTAGTANQVFASSSTSLA